MLTDLEHVVLGVIHLEEPCTAYAVRTVFARSLSMHWSSSAGSIYPAIRRLAERGFIKSTMRRGDRRGASEYRVNSRGRAALAAWISPPLPDGAALMPYDPLRARFRFLGMLPLAKARAAIAEARRLLTAQLARIRTGASPEPALADAMVSLVHRGAELAVSAQLAWLDELDWAVVKKLR